MNTQAKSVVPAPGDPGYTTPPHFNGAIYYVAVQVADGGDLLGEDEHGNEVPAANGYYFQQWDPVSDQGVNGYFGPYNNLEDMPDYVQQNFANIDNADATTP